MQLLNKNTWYNWLLLAGAVLLLNTPIQSIISKYLTFVNGIPFIKEFLAIFLIIVITDVVSSKILEIN